LLFDNGCNAASVDDDNGNNAFEDKDAFDVLLLSLLLSFDDETFNSKDGDNTFEDGGKTLDDIVADEGLVVSIKVEISTVS
jgi:hypothetical protein